MPTNPINPWTLLKETASEFSEDKVTQLGAALAYYTALSIAPLLVISLTIAGQVFDESAARGELQSQLQSLVGADGAKAAEQMIESANKPTEGIIATTLSFIILIFGASGVFGQLQQSLNTIWEVQPKSGRGIWGVIRDRFLSMTMVLGIAFLLLVSLVLSAALTALGTIFDKLPESVAWLSQAAHFGVSFLVIALLFAMMFKYLPDVKIKWRDVALGAIITALLFTIGKFAIGLYLGHSAMASSYGVAGSFVVLLVWVYYSSLILFFGAEFTQVYANRYGSRIVPAENAEPVTEEARAQEGRPRFNRPSTA
jgi:membrane protein